MIALITLTILTALTYITAVLRSTYTRTPPAELRRRASKGNNVAHMLYQVARHGLTADVFLQVLSVSLGAITLVYAARVLGSLPAVIFAFLFIVFVFVRPIGHAAPINTRLAEKIAPYLSKLLIKIRPLTNQISRLFRRYRPITVHTGVYEKEDLIDLLEKQKVAANNRIETTELDIAQHALTFGDKKVKDFMTPRRTVRFVSADDPIGPVLLSELHDSGFSRFPVRGEDENQIVGTLYLRDLVQRTKGGIVSNAMSPKVFYVGEAESLEQVLKAFIRTKHHLFIAVNEFEEVTGLITIEDIIEQILGRKIVDEFDHYGDLREVAAKQAEEDHKHHSHSPLDQTDTEVVE